LSPDVHAVAERAVATLWSRNGPHLRRCIGIEDVGKDLETGSAERFADILHHDRVSQIGLVGAVFAQGLGVRNEREFRRHRLAVGKFFEHTANDRLDRVEDVLLGHETHFQIELVKFARGAVGARILIAKAWRDLEVAVEAGDHNQLLELLRRLRQCVEFSGV